MVRSFNPFECLAEQRQLNNMWTNGNIAVRCGFFNNLETTKANSCPPCLPTTTLSVYRCFTPTIPSEKCLIFSDLLHR